MLYLSDELNGTERNIAEKQPDTAAVEVKKGDAGIGRQANHSRSQLQLGSGSWISPPSFRYLRGHEDQAETDISGEKFASRLVAVGTQAKVHRRRPSATPTVTDATVGSRLRALKTEPAGLELFWATRSWTFPC